MGKRAKPRWKRWLKRGAALTLLAALGLMGWNYLRPMLAEGSVTTYQAYTVQKGDIATSMSFSATISMIHDESFTASGMASVRELYVREAQEVHTGDKLAMMSNGDVFYASFDGIVNEIRAGVGDTMRPGGTVMQVCDIENLQVAMNVDEYDIANVKVGQRCEVTVIALGVTFETVIRHINYVSASMGSVAYYTATMDAAVPDSVLPGMQATVTIPDQRVSGVPVLSMEALSFDGDGAAYVLMKDAGGGYERRSVEVGLNDGMNAQITDGLSVGDEVWVVSGTQSVEPAFSLAGLYKQIVGETVVIQERSIRSGRGARQGRTGAETPDGMTLADGMEVPEGLALPDGAELPEGVALPDDAKPSEGSTLPDDAKPPEGSTLPDATKPPENLTLPDGAEVPEGSTLPDDTKPPENLTLPDEAKSPENSTLPDEAKPLEGSTLPDAMKPPEGSTLHDGANRPENSTPPDATKSPEATPLPDGFNSSNDTAPRSSPSSTFNGGLPHD